MLKNQPLIRIIIEKTPDFMLQPEEVSAVIELPVCDLLDDHLIQNIRMTTSYAENIEVPAFVVEKHIIWGATAMILNRSEEHTSELQSRPHLVCRLLLEKK